MNSYERLLNKYENLVIDDEANLAKDIKGFYFESHNNSVILLNKNIDTNREKKCILAEELGHHFMNKGNILNQDDIVNVKQEKLGRSWGFEELIKLDNIVQLKINKGIRNIFELAEELDITESYLREGLNYFKNKYGKYVNVNKYILNLNTLEIYETIASNEFELNRYINRL